MNLLVVQEIIVTWTKKSRGGAMAAQRNAIPEAFPLPSVPDIKYSSALVHNKVTFYKGAHHHITVEALLQKNVYWGCTSAYWDGTHIVVTFSYNRNCGGAPDRIAFPRKVLTLALGTWGRVRHNGRFSGIEGQWTYQKTVLNIGYFDNLTENVFLTKPQRVFSEMADVW